MSLSIMTAVWKSSPSAGSELLCLLAIADCANDEGQAYPSVKALAAKTRMSDRNVTRAVNALAKSGQLEVKRRLGVGLGNLYRVIVGGDNLSAPPVTTCQGGADNQGTLPPLPSLPLPHTPSLSQPTPPTQRTKEGGAKRSRYVPGTKDFLDDWANHFEGHFGQTYTGDRNRDSLAFKRLVDQTGKSAAELLDLAKLCWAKGTDRRKFFHCSRASTIYGMAAAITDILLELKQPTKAIAEVVGKVELDMELETRRAEALMRGEDYKLVK